MYPSGLTEKLEFTLMFSLGFLMQLISFSQFSLASFLNWISIFVLKLFYVGVSCENPFQQMENWTKHNLPNTLCPSVRYRM